MSTLARRIAIEDYLDTEYRPDREFIDGEVREREDVGKWEHARIQAVLSAWFYNHEAEWDICSSTDCRIQVAPQRVRIPDVVVVRPGPQPSVLVTVPLLVVEILSPGDTYSETQERALDYKQMGIVNVWLIDLKTQTGRASHGDAWVGAARLTVPGTPLYVELPELFRHLS